jgi:acyl-coenzyme A thioesterase PaaI-like protein
MSAEAPHHRPSGEAADPDAGLAARYAAATSLRRLSHALVARDVDSEALEAIEQQARTLADLAELAPERAHAMLAAGPVLFEDDGHDRLPRGDYFPDGLVSGRANPMGFGAALRRRGDEAVLHVTLGAAFEGAPGRAHGGVVATLLDETMGMALSIVKVPAFTGRLTVNYRAPTPIWVPLVARARVVERQDRRLMIAAELHRGTELLADADAVFIIVDPTHFFPPRQPGGPAPS